MTFLCMTQRISSRFPWKYYTSQVATIRAPNWTFRVTNILCQHFARSPLNQDMVKQGNGYNKDFSWEQRTINSKAQPPNTPTPPNAYPLLKPTFPAPTPAIPWTTTYHAAANWLRRRYIHPITLFFHADPFERVKNIFNPNHNVVFFPSSGGLKYSFSQHSLLSLKHIPNGLAKNLLDDKTTYPSAWWSKWCETGFLVEGTKCSQENLTQPTLGQIAFMRTKNTFWRFNWNEILGTDP